METAASVLCLIQSMSIKDIDPTLFKFDWSSDGYFIAALILNLINVVTVLLLFMIHKFYW
jgi:hypothetical protein